MAAYIIRRLFSVIPITLGVLLLVFLIYRVIGGRSGGAAGGQERDTAED